MPRLAASTVDSPYLHHVTCAFFFHWEKWHQWQLLLRVQSDQQRQTRRLLSLEPPLFQRREFPFRREELFSKHWLHAVNSLVWPLTIYFWEVAHAKCCTKFMNNDYILALTGCWNKHNVVMGIICCSIDKETVQAHKTWFRALCALYKLHIGDCVYCLSECGIIAYGHATCVYDTTCSMMAYWLDELVDQSVLVHK